MAPLILIFYTISKTDSRQKEIPMNDHSVKLLADLLGVSIRKVARAHQLRNSYFLLKEPKEDGTMREIWAPHEDLKDVQHLILKEFLYRIPLGENEVFFSSS